MKQERSSASSPDVYNAMGNALQQQSRFEEAVAAYQQALSMKPDLADANNNLGVALMTLGRVEEAVSAFKQALSLAPENADTHYNLGTALKAQGKVEEVAACYLKALLFKPDHANALYNLGNLLEEQGKHDEAVTCYLRVISLKPKHAYAYYNLGNVLLEQGKLKAAADCYIEALSLKPGYVEALYNLGHALTEQDKLPEAVSCLEKALLLKPDYMNAFSYLLYLHASTRDISPEAECRLAATWEYSALNAAARADARHQKFVRPPRLGRQLRVGIVSAEIGDHAVAEFLEPFLEHVDHNRFHLTLFPTTIRPEHRAAQIKALADDVRPLIGLSDAEAAELIRSANMDILMDTTGHTRNGRLGIFAHRAAPVQITYIGYWSTTGLTEMDWIISDMYAPPAFEAHFRENLWRLPRLAVCYRGDHSLPDSYWRPSSDETVWLGSFNRYSKVRVATLGLWAKVMNAIPESKLLLEDRAADESETHERILTMLGRYGIGGERIKFEHFITSHQQHMVLYDRIDIALDTIPFNSGTTAFDALWMGVPLVALEGNWSGGRLASTFLKAFGKPEWIAQTEDEYVSIVAKLAGDVAGRRALRTTQRSRMASSPLCDSTALAKALQNAFEQMFDAYQARSMQEIPSGQCTASRAPLEAAAPPSIPIHCRDNCRA